MDKFLNNNDLVIGAATGYNFNQVKPFIYSLKKTGYCGKICLIIYKNQSLKKELKSLGVDILEISKGNIFGFQKLSILRFNPRIQFIFQTLISLVKVFFHKNIDPRIKSIGQISSLNLSIACSRYYHYLKYISSTNFDRILLADIKDIVFQSNPFEHIGDGIYYAIENHEVTIKDQDGNDKWIKRLFSTKDYNFLKDQLISCSGSTIGSRKEIIDYLYNMVDILATNSHKIPGRYGYDQGAHNYIVWNNIVPNNHHVQNLNGFILTMVTSNEEEILIEDGTLVNKNGSIISIVHQYNWFPNIKFKAIEPSKDI